MKRALVCGGGGFIGHHLVRKLKQKGYYVRVVDQVPFPKEYGRDASDEYIIADLRRWEDARKAVEGMEEVYQLAADMGGMGFIGSHDVECLVNNALINIKVVNAAAEAGVERYFYSSSVCVYRDMHEGEEALSEEDAYPAMPDNDYGMEKLYSERVVLAHGRRFPMKVRIGRFQNCYGPEGTWDGGREKAPAALCRKIAEAKDKDTIKVWGNGRQIRSFIYVDDLIEAVYLLMHSDITEPANIGTEEYVSINKLIDVISEVAGKEINKQYIKGPIGVESRNFSHTRIHTLGWAAKNTLEDGIAKTYPWILKQVNKKKK